MSPAIDTNVEQLTKGDQDHLNPHDHSPRPEVLRKRSTLGLSEGTRIEVVEFVKSTNTSPLLVFLPLGLLAEYLGWSSVAIFVCNLFAVVPLATLLSCATEQLSEYTGQTIGALLNATFGNAVELIVWLAIKRLYTTPKLITMQMSMVALSKGDIRVVQTSMIGAVLSNLLLGLGWCIMAAGGFAGDSTFNAEAAGAMSSLMTLASAALIIPAVYVAFDPRRIMSC